MCANPLNQPDLPIPSAMHVIYLNDTAIESQPKEKERPMNARALHIAGLLLLLSLGCMSSQVHAQNATTDAGQNSAPAPVVNLETANSNIIADGAKAADGWEKRLNELQALVDNRQTNSEALREAAGQVRPIQTDILAIAKEVRPLRDDVKARLDKLGPPPKEDGPAEANEVAEQRVLLNRSFALHDGLVKKLDVLAVKARQIADLINGRLRARFTNRLFKPLPEIYSSAFWQTAFSSIGVQWSLATRQLGIWQERILDRISWRTLILMFLPIVAAIALSTLLMKMFRRSPLGRLRASEHLSNSARGARAITGALVATTPILVGFALLWFIAREAGLEELVGSGNVIASFVLIGVAIFYWALVRRAFAPSDIELRLFPKVTPIASRTIAYVLFALIALWLVNAIAAVVDAALFAPLALTILREAVVAFISATLCIGLISIPLRAHSASRNGWPRWMFNGLIGLAGFVALTLLLGFVSLAEFTGSQLIGTGGVLLAMYLVHTAADYVSSTEAVGMITRAGTVGSGQRQDKPTIGVTRMTASLVLDFVMLALGIPALLLQWGFDWVEVHGWISTAFFGFQIGNFTISIQTIVVAVAIIVAGLAATRLVQRWFMHRSNVAQRADSGVRDSIKVVLGYLGILISGALAVSYLGIDFTNIAIVAGALSVGIGFGLQNIVSNFISGLILLAERPIKAGDWIVVGATEGIVQSVNVRATEIRTFDRSSVLIPNSALITGEVTNWTLGNTLARVIVNVGVAYDTDPKRVMAILNDVGRQHPLCLEHPAPQLIFEDFADSAMNFSLRIFLADVRNSLQVTSELRTAIWSRFREEGIEIPFPQRDLNIRHVAKAKDETLEDFLFGQENVA